MQWSSLIVDLLGAHMLVVDLHIEPAHLEARHVGHQKRISSHTKESPDVAGKQGLALGSI